MPERTGWRAFGERRHMRDFGDQPPQPPRVDAERGLSASGHALAQQERVCSLVKGVSLCFFGGSWRG